jgi:protein required for attachment to host cells
MFEGVKKKQALAPMASSERDKPLPLHQAAPKAAVHPKTESTNVSKIAIPHDAVIFVGDGRKALFLRNDGDEKFANFVTLQVMAEVNPASHEQGTDRPGRAFASAHSSARSAVESTDWHEIEEHRFAQRAAAVLETVIRERSAPALVIAAPAKTLAELRKALHADVKAKLIAEFDKDFTKIPVWEIEKHIVG